MNNIMRITVCILKLSIYKVSLIKNVEFILEEETPVEQLNLTRKETLKII